MAFRQVDQRHISSEITLMEWSPTMDLIALATAHGEVLLHRLSWQKVWSVPAEVTKDEEIKVTVLAWRPDGKVLGVAYNTGKMSLLDVENAEILHGQEVGTGVSCMHWAEHKRSEGTEPAFYTDNSSLFLPKYSALVKNFATSKNEDTVDDAKRLKCQHNMNLLVVGTDAGLIHIYAFGIFPCGWFCVDEPGHKPTSKIISVALSSNLSVITTFLETTVEAKNKFYYYRSFSLPLMQHKTEEFKVIALNYGQIASLLTVLLSTIHAISEAWEDVLLEIDTKLVNYAKEKRNVSKASISDDFLELLMFGTPSDSLEKFLLHDLTENGLKKFGHSIEMAYSNIQKLVLKKLQTVATSMYYHLSDLKGMALWKEKFGALGLSFDHVNVALSSIGSFLVKATEIQQVIDSSMKNFKAFFRWLYAVILRLSDEPLPAEVTKVTQQDLNFVAEFLKDNFAEEWNTGKNSSFKVERIGQYLKDENLILPPTVVDNPWIKFLEKNLQLKESKIVFPYYPEKSLVQQHTDVCRSIELAFSGPWTIFPNHVTKRNEYVLYKNCDVTPFKVTHTTSLNNDFLLSVFVKDSTPAEYLYIMQESLYDEKIVEGLSLTLGELPCFLAENSSLSSHGQCLSHKIIDAKFYNAETLSVLLIENTSLRTDCPVLLKLPIKNILSQMKRPSAADDGSICSNFPQVDGEFYVDKAGHKRLENIKVIDLAVSGSRKVACVLFASRRQVRLFEMEVEDDDDEQDDIENEDHLKEFSDPEEAMPFYGTSFQNKDGSP